jgi:hypothetical protein
MTTRRHEVYGRRLRSARHEAHEAARPAVQPPPDVGLTGGLR